MHKNVESTVKRVIHPSLAVHFFRSVTDFVRAQHLKSGVQVISSGGQKIDILVQDNGAPSTVIFFHGAVPTERIRPIFVGNGLSRRRNFNRISISDPTIATHDLRVAWYAGSLSQPDLQCDIIRIVDHALHLLGTPARPIFVGSSAGGGFASLQISRHFPESCALIMNPQTSISRYETGPVAQYLETAWNVDSVEELPPTVEHDLTQVYSNRHKNNIFYVQNVYDWFHKAYHQAPFFSALSGSSALWLLSDEWGDRSTQMGHTIPPKTLVDSILTKLLECGGDWGAAAKLAGFARPK